jgi:predicted metalloprotease with PDZ domain
MVKPYTFDDVVNALNQVAPYDWRGFWTERLTNHGPGAPLGGIEGSGWKVVYDDTPSAMDGAAADSVNACYSLGLELGATAVSATPSKACPRPWPASARDETGRSQRPPLFSPKC